jgi:hypothetical protein
MNNHMGGRAVVGCLTLFELTEHNMYRLLALAIAASTALAATTAVAAPERVRGTVAAVSGNTLTVRTTLGQNVPVLFTLQWPTALCQVPARRAVRNRSP